MAPAEKINPTWQQAEANYGKAFREVSPTPKYLSMSPLTSVKASLRCPSDTVQSWTLRCAVHADELIIDDNAPPHYKAHAHSMKAVLLVLAGGDNFEEAKADLEAAEANVKKAKEMYAGQGVDGNLDKLARTVERAWGVYRKEENEAKGDAGV
jgi:hypothetical protein